MAMQPNNTTQVTAKAVSACRARMSGAIATTAVQPHTAVPMASSSPRRRGTASRRAMPMPAMSATVRQLRAIGSAVAAMAVAPPRVRRSPTSAMPTRSSRYMAQFSIGVPAWAGSGLNWAMYRLLRVGIALIGLRLTLGGATAIAATALPVALSCLTVALIAGIGIARLLAVPRRLGLLLAIGTAVCGCTAVVAMAPLIRARHAETAFAVTCVVLFGCIAMLFYPWVAGHFLAASPVHAGIFLGTAIHDTSQVIGAALIYSQQAAAPAALAAASVAKLLRNLSIAVLLPVAAWLAQRREARAGAPAPAAAGGGTRAPRVPLFVLAFIGFIV